MEIDTSMRALPVVVPYVLPKDSLEMAMAKDKDPIEAFSPNRPHPTFSVGIGPRRSDRRVLSENMITPSSRDCAKHRLSRLPSA